jgi:hypothetical protein
MESLPQSTQERRKKENSKNGSFHQIDIFSRELFSHFYCFYLAWLILEPILRLRVTTAAL